MTNYIIITKLGLILTFGLIIYLTMALIPSDYYGYGINNTTNVESFSASDNGKTCNPLIPTTYLNSVAGPFTLFLQNPNQNITKTFIIVGTNIITISTDTGQFVMTAANSPVIMLYSGGTWTSSADAEPILNNTPLIQVASNQTFYYGTQITVSPTYLFISSTGYNNGSGAIFVYNYESVLSGNLVPLSTIPGVNGFVSGFGYSMKATDQYLFAGAPGTNIGNGLVGVVNIFERVGNTWNIKQQINYPNIYTYACFGFSVACSADGSVLAIGAPSENNQGAAYIYRKNNLDVWVQEDYLLTPFVVTNPIFGLTVAVSEDGTTIAVSSTGGTPAAIGTRGVIVYIYNSTTSSWDTQQVINPTAVSRVGEYISFDATGNILAFSSPANPSGFVEVYTRSAGVWTFQQTLTPTIFPAVNNPNFFGFSMAMSRDGTKIIASNPRDDSDRGGVWYFNFTGGIWVETNKFTTTNASYYGLEVDFSYNSSKALITNLGLDLKGSVNLLNYTDNKVDFTLTYSNDQIRTIIMNSRVFFFATPEMSLSPDTKYFAVYQTQKIHFFERISSQFQEISTISNLDDTNSPVFVLANDYLYFVSRVPSGATAMEIYLNVYQLTINYTSTNTSVIKPVKSWILINQILVHTIPIKDIFDAPIKIFTNSNNTTIIIQIGDTIASIRTVYVYDYVLGVLTQIQVLTPPYTGFLINLANTIALSEDALTMAIADINGDILIYTRASIGVVFTLATTIVTGVLVQEVSISNTSPYILLAYNGSCQIYTGSGAVWGLTQTVAIPFPAAPLTISKNGKYFYVANEISPSLLRQLGFLNIYKSTNLLTWSLYKTITQSNANIDFYSVRTDGRVRLLFGSNLVLSNANNILIVAATAYGGSTNSFFVYT